jgi:hypothetical protein
MIKHKKSAWGNLVIGDTMFEEGANFKLYECLGFDEVLTEEEINVPLLIL